MFYVELFAAFMAGGFLGSLAVALVASSASRCTCNEESEAGSTDAG